MQISRKHRKMPKGKQRNEGNLCLVRFCLPKQEKDDDDDDGGGDFMLTVARIALVKPEKARGVEDVLLRAAQMGQMTEKVSEERLISLLEQINVQTSKQTKVTIQRRRSVLEDDD
ncbi:DNA-binding protein DDB_G0278111-like isoform X5 [Phoenix dactylifera]|nr:DNA-binding protein DDB_G0278111-like isoform X5 [Phoenix dactylifera]